MDRWVHHLGWWTTYSVCVCMCVCVCARTCTCVCVCVRAWCSSPRLMITHSKMTNQNREMVGILIDYFWVGDHHPRWWIEIICLYIMSGFSFILNKKCIVVQSWNAALQQLRIKRCLLHFGIEARHLGPVWGCFSSQNSAQLNQLHQEAAQP
jgi:hypothetical protein